MKTWVSRLLIVAGVVFVVVAEARHTLRPSPASTGGSHGPAASWMVSSARSEAASYGDPDPRWGKWGVANPAAAAQLLGTAGKGSRLGSPDYLVVLRGRFHDPSSTRVFGVLLYTLDPRLHSIEDAALERGLPSLRGVSRLRPLRLSD